MHERIVCPFLGRGCQKPVLRIISTVFNGDDSILHRELLFSLHGKIRPQVNVFAFDRLTGHETNLGKCFLYGKNQGLDHGIGHMASMSPEKNERLTPSKD